MSIQLMVSFGRMKMQPASQNVYIDAASEEASYFWILQIQCLENLYFKDVHIH